MLNPLSLTKRELKDRTQYRCEHRHNGLDHPRCYDAAYNLHSGYLDIETTNLKADFGVILTWCIKERGNPKIVWDCITRRDIEDELYDKRVIESLIEEMLKYQTLYTYYGSRFDITFARSRALYWGLDFPPFGSIQHIDVYYQVRNRFNIHSNRLECACDLLGIKGKTHLSGPKWIAAMFGKEEAMRYILEHNMFDVKITERLHDRIEPYFKGNKKSI